MKRYEVPCWFAGVGLYAIATAQSLQSPAAVAGAISLTVAGVASMLTYLEGGKREC